MSTPKLDARKGCLMNDEVDYLPLPDNVRFMYLHRVHAVNVDGNRVKPAFFTNSKDVARLMFNLGHTVD